MKVPRGACAAARPSGYVLARQSHSRRELHSTKNSPVPRDVAPRAESTPRRFDRLRRLPWLPLLIVALIILSAPFAVDPLRDAANGGAISEATLRRSGGYLL